MSYDGSTSNGSSSDVNPPGGARAPGSPRFGNPKVQETWDELAEILYLKFTPTPDRQAPGVKEMEHIAVIMIHRLIAKGWVPPRPDEDDLFSLSETLGFHEGVNK